MSGPVKKKLCWNCDASVPLESDTCLYCGVAVASAISEGDEEEEPRVAMPPPLYGKPASRAAPGASSHSMQQQGQAMPPQGLQAGPQAGMNAMNKKRVPPPQPAFRGKPAMKIREEAADVQQETLSLQKQPNTLIALFLLLGGSTFFLFGLVIMLFSDQGALILRWNRDQALIYLGVGCCFLLAGWRFILRIEE